LSDDAGDYHQFCRDLGLHRVENAAVVKHETPGRCAHRVEKTLVKGSGEVSESLVYLRDGHSVPSRYQAFVGKMEWGWGGAAWEDGSRGAGCHDLKEWGVDLTQTVGSTIENGPRRVSAAVGEGR